MENNKNKKQDEQKNNNNKISLDKAKVIAVSALKIALPVIACIVVIITIVSLVNAREKSEEGTAATASADNSQEVSSLVLSEEPIEENAYEEVNTLMNSFYQALANGDTDTIKAVKDFTSDMEIITYQKKSEYIEAYNNITSYTKKGIYDNSYFVYVYYDVKFFNIETTAPGLNTWFVYTADDGSLKIDGDMDETVTAYLKLMTNQDDVVDLFNRVDVKYKEAVAADDSLNTFLTELPNQIKTSVGVALAQLEAQNNEPETQAETVEVQTEEAEEETPQEPVEEAPQTQVVNQQVKATDTVNVRSSDSEEADKIGRVEVGTTLTRIEEKINGWSKVIYEGNEAYIKSDYLEVISEESLAETTGNAATAIGTVKAKTNVNVRNSASETADKIGVALGESTYNLLENAGEWLKIDYNGQTGYVKAEYFE